MTTPSTAIRPVVIGLLVSVPLLGFALDAVSWLSYGLDLPFLDDWGDYFRRDATSFALAHLFSQANDTIYPVGRILEVIAQITIHGNSVAHQFISMVVLLGALFVLQWKLLNIVFDDKLVAAALLGFCVFMLQPGTYWGLQSNAYVQGLPALGIVAIAYVFVHPRYRALWGVPLLAALGLATGLSYISGAFAEVAVALVVLLCAFRSSRPEARDQLLGGAALLAVGLGTAIMQMRAIAVGQGWRLHRPDAHWAFPNERDYWLYLLGKLGRALALPAAQPYLSLVVVVTVFLGVAALFVWFVYRALKDRLPDHREYRLCLVFCSLAAANFVYLNQVAAGRTKLRPEAVTALPDVFVFGFLNAFHFFWLTLLWPWLAASLVFLLRRHARFPRGAYPLVAVSAAVMATAILGGGVFDNPSAYRRITETRRQDVACLQSQIAEGVGIDCPNLFPADLARPFVYARSIGASFVRYFPFPETPLGTNRPPPIFRLSSVPAEALGRRNVASSRRTDKGWEIESGGNPQLFFRAGPPDGLRRCVAMRVTMEISAKGPDTATLYFALPGMETFSDAQSEARSFLAPASGSAVVSFELDSPTGFLDLFRLDAVHSPQPFTIREIELRCLLAIAAGAP